MSGFSMIVGLGNMEISPDEERQLALDMIKGVVGTTADCRFVDREDTTPVELGFHCPKCKGENIAWSKWAYFIWCKDCQRMFPTCASVKGDGEEALNNMIYEFANATTETYRQGAIFATKKLHDDVTRQLELAES